MARQNAIDLRHDRPSLVDNRVLSGAETHDALVQDEIGLALAPLVIDVDAFLPADLDWELALDALKARPAAIVSLAHSLARGRSQFSREAARLAGSGISATALDPRFRAALNQARLENRPTILLTGGDVALLDGLRVEHPGIRDVVSLPDEGEFAQLERTAAVRSRCPQGCVALPMQQSGAAWARNAAVYEVPSADASDDRLSRLSPARMWIKALRIHQWAKNLLVFVPLVLAGHALDAAAWVAAMTAFLAFGLAASSTYLLNDLHDLGADRAHQSKRHRPLASGALRIPHALAAAVLGLSVCAVLATTHGPAGAATIAAYLGLTLLYTFAIKRHAVTDVITLGALFTLRLVAGIAFCGVAGSAWLLAFSMFVFSSLAFGKRFVEIDQLARSGKTAIAGRGYVVQDAPAVLALGAATSTAAVLILSLYIVEVSARSAFYVNAELLWAAPVALFLWLARIWILCGRGELRDDPVEFALTDRPSLILGFVVAGSFAAACIPF